MRACIILLIAAFGILRAADTLVLIGDSITAGASAGENAIAYPELLKKRLGGTAIAVRAQGGASTGDGVDWVRSAEFWQERGIAGARRFLIMLGTNDLKEASDASVAEAVASLKSMVAEIRKQVPDARIHICTPIAFDATTMSEGNRGKGYDPRNPAVAALARRYQAIAAELRTGFIDLTKAVSPGHYTDGVHPDARGHVEIATAVATGLAK